MRLSTFGWCAPLTVPLTVFVALGAASCFAESIGDTSIIAGLLDMAVLEPLAVADGNGRAIEAGARAQATQAALKVGGRQSVPARDRAATYRSEEVFRNSKVAMPLLVVDLEPQMIFVPQPMSGRSVGATPAAAWTRTSRIPVAEERRTTPATWAVSGR